jgi:hypothetical protein
VKRDGFLSGLLFGPEDGSDNSLLKYLLTSPDYSSLYPIVVRTSNPTKRNKPNTSDARKKNFCGILNEEKFQQNLAWNYISYLLNCSSKLLLM